MPNVPDPEGGRKDSRLYGFEMPMESEPHARTFMQWPVNLDVYDRRTLARTQDAIARIANTISAYEPIVVMMAAEHQAAARKLLSGDVEIWDIPTDDLWCRDSGPTFVRNAAGDLAMAHIQFNGWGNKQPHGNDALVAERVAERLGLPLLDTGLVGEQGGLEHEGPVRFSPMPVAGSISTAIRLARMKSANECWQRWAGPK